MRLKVNGEELKEGLGDTLIAVYLNDIVDLFRDVCVVYWFKPYLWMSDWFFFVALFSSRFDEGYFGLLKYSCINVGF